MPIASLMENSATFAVFPPVITVPVQMLADSLPGCDRRQFRVVQKVEQGPFRRQLLQIVGLIDFQISFTAVRKARNLQQTTQYFPLHFKRVDALPLELQQCHNMANQV